MDVVLVVPISVPPNFPRSTQGQLTMDDDLIVVFGALLKKNCLQKVNHKDYASVGGQFFKLQNMGQRHWIHMSRSHMKVGGYLAFASNFFFVGNSCLDTSVRRFAIASEVGFGLARSGATLQTSGRKECGRGIVRTREECRRGISEIPRQCR